LTQSFYPQKRLTSDFRKDEVFVFADGPHRFVKELSGARLLMQHDFTGHEFPMDEDALIELLGDGKARRLRQPRDRQGAIKLKAQLPELSIEDYHSKAGVRARALRFYTVKFDEDTSAKKSVSFLKGFIDRWRSEAVRRGITFEISPHQLIRAIDSCGEPGDRQTRYFVSQQGKGKRARLHPTIERILEDSVDFYYSERRILVKDAISYFLNALGMENQERTKKGLSRLVVGKRCEVVRTRVNAAINHDNWSIKYSKYEADRKFNGVGNHLTASYAGELVIIDHTVMDGFALIDSKSMLPLGRPWLSFAVDVYSRAILAFLITAEPPSVYSVTTLLKRMNRSKSYMASMYPHIELPWNTFCHATTVLIDNGWDLKANSTIEALSDLGTEVVYAPVLTPEYKAIGERFHHTVNKGLIHKLPGSLPYDLVLRRKLSAQELDVDPTKDAVLTVEILDDLMHQFIVSYEHERHEGVGGIPARLWQDSLLRQPRRVIDDINALDSILGKVDQCTLTKAGIRFKNMQFHERGNTTMLLDELLRLAPKRSQSRDTTASARIKVKIKYNPADASRIHVWHPHRHEYVVLFNRDDRYSEGLSFWAAALIFKFAKEQDMAFVTDEQRVRAQVRMREFWSQFMVEKTISPREARRLLAQDQPTLEGTRIAHETAESRHDGRGKSKEVAVGLFGLDRVDADKPVKGRQKGSRRPTKSTRNPKVDTAPALTDHHALVLPDDAPGYVPSTTEGWGGNE
jgi:putative transposase